MAKNKYRNKYRIVSGSSYGIAYYEVQRKFLFFWYEFHRIYVEENNARSAYDKAVDFLSEVISIEDLTDHTCSDTAG